MKIFLSVLLSVSLGLSSLQKCAGQNAALDSGYLYFIATKFQTGNILVEDPSTKPLAINHPWLLQVDFSVLKNIQRTWNYCNCYSKNGASLSYVNFGNPDQLGKAVNLVFFAEPYFSFSKKLQFSFRGGAGFSFLNKIYDPQTNPGNTFYSKHLSFMLMLNLNAYYSINSSLRLSITSQYNHISNGGTRDPNWGMNFPTIGAGMEYMLPSQQLKRRPFTPYTDRAIKIITHLFVGPRILQAANQWPEERRIVMGLNTGLTKPLGRVVALGIGAEIYYDGTASAKQERTGKEFKAWTGSLSLQNYLFFGKLLFGQQLAYQITTLNPDTPGKVYERYFLEYEIAQHWYLGVSLKAYGNMSDYMTFSSGYIF